MATTWLVTNVQQTGTKGETSTSDTTDNTTSTTNLGARTTTSNLGARTTTSNLGARTTTSSLGARTNSNTNTLTEDAGGQVRFVIKINGGLNTDTANPAVCPIP